MSRHFIASLIIVLLAAMSWWLVDQPEQQRQVKPDVAGGSDYYAEGMVVTTMDENGQPKQQLASDRLVHFEDGRAELYQPQLQIFRPQGAPWQIVSPRASQSADETEWLLHEQVNIDRAETPEERPIHIVTRNLHLWPEQEYAETDEVVRMTSRQDWVTGRGLQAWFDGAARIKLLAEAKGRYELD